MSYPEFKGNCPGNVAKDAKYSVKSGPEGPVVALIYRTQDEEKWHATTEEHPELVKMVNDVKISEGQPPNGAFYINEYKQVIVPVGSPVKYFLAGKYEKPLRFEFEGYVLSGEPVDLDGNPLSPGDMWVGPHPGIPYVLCAGGKDIRYSMSPRPNVTKNVFLSKKIGPADAQILAKKITAIAGFDGGRFYVNEFGSIFKPIKEGWDTKYYYVGQLDLAKWFPHESV